MEAVDFADGKRAGARTELPTTGRRLSRRTGGPSLSGLLFPTKPRWRDWQPEGGGVGKIGMHPYIVPSDDMQVIGHLTASWRIRLVGNIARSRRPTSAQF